jgi:hypothetical protein
MARAYSWAAEAKRVERESAKRWRELERSARSQAKWEEKQRAAHDVSVYESKIQFLSSMHKDCGPVLNWQKIVLSPRPEQPQRLQTHEEPVLAAANGYKPSFFESLFGSDRKRRAQLQEAVVEAQRKDWETFAALQKHYEDALRRHEWETRVASGVLSGDLKAYQKVIDHMSPFAELIDSGMLVVVEDLRSSVVVLECSVDDSTVVPGEEKRLSANGKLIAKKLAAGTYWALYQDYVCGCALRVAREIFALLPLPRVVINVSLAGVDSSTGHQAALPILAASIPRETAARLNYESLDPSDSLKNFAHRMKFKKTSGFDAIDPMSADESFITTAAR